MNIETRQLEAWAGALERLLAAPPPTECAQVDERLEELETIAAQIRSAAIDGAHVDVGADWLNDALRTKGMHPQAVVYSPPVLVDPIVAGFLVGLHGLDKGHGVFVWVATDVGRIRVYISRLTVPSNG